MNKLKQAWDDLTAFVSITITLQKFTEDSYDETWDEGKATFPEYGIAARVKYDLSERDIELLGENLLLDAVVTIRDVDLAALSTDVESQDRFVITAKTYCITKIMSRIVKGEKTGYVIGVKEVQ